MKQTWAICKAELRQLFCSPIAWLILVIFSYQTYQAFTDCLSSFAGDLELHGGVSNVTYGLFAHYRGIYSVIKDTLSIFIPLLTMGLMSRDLNSGSIKLLYSSPITSSQIIAGKFLSMILFSAVMLGVTVPAIIFTAFSVENADFGLIFSGLAGQFLLFWAYSAIGLFMSCLTSYQIVAALLTLGALGFLNKLSSMGQELDFVRDITYWASLSGRTDQLTEGLVTSEDIIYFAIVILLFLSYSIYLLQYKRDRRKLACALKYVGTTVAVLAVGYVSSRPGLILYHDASQVDANTLTDTSIKVVKDLQGPLDITTYVNFSDYDCWAGAPVTISDEKKRYSKYTRFKPDIRMNYVYYYDEAYHNMDYGVSETGTKEMAVMFAGAYGVPMDKVLTPEQIRARIDLSGEQNHLVKQLTAADGQKSWLRFFSDMTRYPEEQEITTALYRLEHKAPVVAFLTGHNERDAYRADDSEYNGFSSALDVRESLVNIGFDVKRVCADTVITADVLVISDLKKEMTDIEKANVISYLDAGGNMILALEPQRIGLYGGLLEYLGVGALPGTVVYPGSDTAPTLIPAVTTDYASVISEWFFPGMTVSMPTAAAIDYDLASEWDAVPVLATPGTECWNEVEVTDFGAVADASELAADRKAGEFRKSHSLAIALRRPAEGREQRVMVLGDADCLSNMEMTVQRKTLTAFNSRFCTGIFNWMSYGTLPVDTSRKDPIDNNIRITSSSTAVWTIILKWVLQIILAAAGITLITRRQRR